jgi:hypothetical protein
MYFLGLESEMLNIFSKFLIMEIFASKMILFFFILKKNLPVVVHLHNATIA